MAVQGLDIILRLVKEEKLVENLGERELKNPEGNGFDLRLGAIHKVVEGGAFIEVDGKGGLGKRKGVKTEVIAEFKPDSDEQESVTIAPGQYYLVSTYETVNMPTDLTAYPYPRSSLQRCGLLLLVTDVDPGYKGTLAFGLVNLSPFEVTLQMGARFCNIVFTKIDGDTAQYRGQHQGGRVSPQEVEQQV